MLKIFFFFENFFLLLIELMEDSVVGVHVMPPVVQVKKPELVTILQQLMVELIALVIFLKIVISQLVQVYFLFSFFASGIF
jgi:hypothetical protein